MNWIFADRNEMLCAYWLDFCKGVTVHHGSIMDVEADAIVSPANSFGFMDGGIDLLYSEVLGWQVQERLQKLIREKHHGELLVGQAEVVETSHSKYRYVIAAPTMRIPCEISKTMNAYLAFRATILAAKTRLDIKTVVVPGLGTGTGKLHPLDCAKQMALAFKTTSSNYFPASLSDAYQNWHVP